MRNEVGNEAGSRANGNGAEASSSHANPIRLKTNQNANRTGTGYRRPVGNDERVVGTTNRAGSTVIDLTEEPELEVLSSTVRPTPRKVSAKKRRRDESAGGNRDSSGRPILESHRLDQVDTPISPPQEPEKKNPVCGICLEAMGTNTERPMMAGNCGYACILPRLPEASRKAYETVPFLPKRGYPEAD
eukprot:jgi/Picsp_1/3856/NSC_01368-R1_---NA---